MRNKENANNDVTAEPSIPVNEAEPEHSSQLNAGSIEPDKTASTLYTQVFDISTWTNLLLFKKLY